MDARLVPPRAEARRSWRDERAQHASVAERRRRAPPHAVRSEPTVRVIMAESTRKARVEIGHLPAVRTA